MGSVAVPEAVSCRRQGCRIPWVLSVAPSRDNSQLQLSAMLGFLRSHCSTRFCCSLLHSGLRQPPELFCVISRSSPSPSPSSPPPPPLLIPAPSSCLHPCQAKGRAGNSGLCPGETGKEGRVEGRGRSSILRSLCSQSPAPLKRTWSVLSALAPLKDTHCKLQMSPCLTALQQSQRDAEFQPRCVQGWHTEAAGTSGSTLESELDP